MRFLLSAVAMSIGMAVLPARAEFIELDDYYVQYESVRTDTIVRMAARVLPIRGDCVLRYGFFRPTEDGMDFVSTSRFPKFHLINVGDFFLVPMIRHDDPQIVVSCPGHGDAIAHIYDGE